MHLIFSWLFPWLLLQPAPPANRTPSSSADMGIPVHVKPPAGVVSPEPGGSALLTNPPAGERIVPRCEHGPNPGDVLRLETAVYELTVGKNLRLRRKLTFSPTSAWKPFCDHEFFVGEPETAWTANAAARVWFTQPPRPRQDVDAETREFTPKIPKTTEKWKWMGARLTLAPLPGNPSDHRLVLEIEQECTVFPEAGEDGTVSLNLPLAHLGTYTPGTDTAVEVTVEFSEPWHFLGATQPESGVLENRVAWKFPGLPAEDLKILFSDTPPEEKDPAPQSPKESLADQVVRFFLLGLIGLVPLAVLLYVLARRRHRKPAGSPRK